jgi:hypothetical protein
MGTVVVRMPNSRRAVINTEGRIDNAAEYAFTRGQCHSLALALHRMTGWELYGLYSEYDWTRKQAGRESTPSHVVVRSPEGKYIDITGDDALEGWHQWWPDATPHSVTEAEVLGFSDIDYIKPDITAATPYALTLWVKYGNGQPVQLHLPFAKETA